IKEEKLKEAETRKFIENAFCDGEIKTTGTDIDRLMPPISRFGGGNRTTKKQGVIDKLKSFFEKFFGVGGSFTADTPKVLNYADSSSKQALMMVAEDTVTYD
ncbi:MAG: type I restriction endonuclease subunit R, partial [Clostridiales bacterium]|nr:type I restriction endonuclease subunit R [Clostridiales bacterium]MBS5877675.1 type I restriction endonuclease subunit R [Clostridiales bacterium]